MIELVERIFMKKNIRVNKAIDIISIGMLTIFMILMAQYTIVSLAIVPIVLAIFFIRKNVIDSSILVLFMGLLSLVFSFTKETYAIFIAMFILSMSLYLTIKLNMHDINSTLVVFVVSAIILNLGYYYLIKINAIDLNKFVDELVLMFKNEGFDYPKEVLLDTIKNIPAVLSVIGYLYGLIALKTTRNYLNYKDKSIGEFSKINTLEISIREVVFALILALVLTFGAKIFGLNHSLVAANAISLGISLLQINGLLTLDFVLERRKSRSYRIFAWILIIFLFSFLSIFLLVLGVVDVLFGLRGVLYAREK